MPRGGPPFPLENLAPYYRGARFALVAMKLRHPEDKAFQEDADRYIEMVDGYSRVAVQTFKLRQEKREGRGTTG